VLAAYRDARVGNIWGVLTPGTPAPDFTLPDEDANPVALQDLRGRWVLLWWYPKASTPG
jgi:peroxiredoxin Q/BCP